MCFALIKKTIDHLIPLLCSEIKSQLSDKNGSQSDQWASGQDRHLVSLLAQELQCDANDIADYDLSLYDTQPAATSGLFSDFLCSSRLDNLASCFVLMETLIDHSAQETLNDDSDISIMALFDHEEVGSDSVTGAGSTLIDDTIHRILASTCPSISSSQMMETSQISRSKSLILSVDMAHAVHPNYASKHERQHSPLMNKGLVIKSNVNQRYATNPSTAFLLRELSRRESGDLKAEEEDLIGRHMALQEFAVKNDCPCGSTIGPT